MLNQLLNKLTANILHRRMRAYLDYPEARTALILIDVQPAFLADQSLLLPKLAKVIAFARSRNMAIIYSPFGGARPAHSLAPGIAELFTRLESSTETPLPEELAPHDGDIVLPARSTLSAFIGKSFIASLRDAGIEHVILAGSFADLSIDSTARDATERDFHTTILSDCCGATSQDAHDATIGVTLPRMVHAVTSSKDWFQHAAKQTGGKQTSPIKQENEQK